MNDPNLRRLMYQHIRGQEGRAVADKWVTEVAAFDRQQAQMKAQQDRENNLQELSRMAEQAIREAKIEEAEEADRKRLRNSVFTFPKLQFGVKNLGLPERNPTPDAGQALTFADIEKTYQEVQQGADNPPWYGTATDLDGRQKTIKYEVGMDIAGASSVTFSSEVPKDTMYMLNVKNPRQSAKITGITASEPFTFRPWFTESRPWGGRPAEPAKPAGPKIHAEIRGQRKITLGDDE